MCRTVVGCGAYVDCPLPHRIHVELQIDARLRRCASAHLLESPMRRLCLSILLSATVLATTGAFAQPPVAKVAPVVDDYYGTSVTDPYR